MVMPEHEAEWPDKAMFAGILLTLAGAIGVIYSILRIAGATLGDDVPALLLDWPTWIMLPMSVITLGLGIVATRHQSALFLYLGAVTGIASLAAIGLVPILSLLAAAFMIKAHIEGEDTVLGTETPDAEDWPDKALAASMMLFATGVITLFQGVLTFTENFAPIIFETAWVWATITTVIGVICIWSAREIFHLRRAWAGNLGAILGVLGLGMYVIGPLLSLAALVLLFKAGQEEEFLEPLDA